jgi:putative endonuclease
MGYCVYILYSAKIDRYYVGMREDLDKRLVYHNHPISPSKFTSKGVPWVIYFSIRCSTKSQSLRLERLIKSKKSRGFIESLPIQPDLVQKLLKETSI